MANTGKTRFKGKGLGVTDKHRPVSVMLPPDIDKAVRSLPNRSDWLREAIAKKLEEEGLLPESA